MLCLFFLLVSLDIFFYLSTYVSVCWMRSGLFFVTLEWSFFRRHVFSYHCSNEIEVNCYLLKCAVKRHAMSRKRCISNRFNANCTEFVCHPFTLAAHKTHISFFIELNHLWLSLGFNFLALIESRWSFSLKTRTKFFTLQWNFIVCVILRHGSWMLMRILGNYKQLFGWINLLFGFKNDWAQLIRFGNAPINFQPAQRIEIPKNVCISSASVHCVCRYGAFKTCTWFIETTTMKVPTIGSVFVRICSASNCMHW